jgi:hypothetical protein
VANLALHDVRFRAVVAPEFEVGEEAALGPAVPNSSWYVVLALRNVSTGATTRSALNLRQPAYVPMAIFAALTLAAPARQRRPRSILLGLTLLGAFILLSISAPLVLLLAEPRIRAIELGEGARSWVTLLFNSTAETSCAAPVFLWFLAGWVIDAVQDRHEHKSELGRSATEQMKFLNSERRLSR